MNYTCEPLARMACQLGEGPVWDPRQEALYWIDGLGCRWFRRNQDAGVEAFPTPSPIGSITLAVRGAVMALADGLYHLDLSSGALTPFLNLEPDVAGNRLNDGKADPQGNLLVGSMSTLANDGGPAPFTGALYQVRPDGRIKTLLTGVGISNGLDFWGSTLYYVDSPTGCVQSFDYDARAGELSNRRVCVRIPAEEGIPDGLCIDAEGMLWVAQWGGWCVSRWDPASAERLGKVNVPVKHVTSCAFGGERLDQLFITTSTNGVTGDEWRRQPLAGSVFVARPGVTGVAACRFGEEGIG